MRQSPKEQKARRKAYYKAHRAQIVAKQATYRKSHRAERAFYNTNYYKTNKAEIIASVRMYQKAHKAEKVACSAAWYKANKAEIIASVKVYRKANKANLAAKATVWRKANLDKCRDIQARRRARKRGATVEKVERRLVFERDQGRCHLCGKKVNLKNWHLDHIIPLARGGEHSYRNVAVSCPRCNMRKQNKMRGQLRLF